MIKTGKIHLQILTHWKSEAHRMSLRIFTLYGCHVDLLNLQMKSYIQPEQLGGKKINSYTTEVYSFSINYIFLIFYPTQSSARQAHSSPLLPCETQRILCKGASHTFSLLSLKLSSELHNRVGTRTQVSPFLIPHSNHYTTSAQYQRRQQELC